MLGPGLRHQGWFMIPDWGPGTGQCAAEARGRSLLGPRYRSFPVDHNSLTSDTILHSNPTSPPTHFSLPFFFSCFFTLNSFGGRVFSKYAFGPETRPT